MILCTLLNSFNPELQLKNTESAIRNNLKELLTELVWRFKKVESDNITKLSTFYLNSKAEIIINKSDIEGVLESFYGTIISSIQKLLGKSLGWIIDSVEDRTINVSTYNPLTGSSYLELPKELDHQEKSLIDIQKLMIINVLNAVWSESWKS